MSGIGGFYRFDGAPADIASVERMLALIPHRGANAAAGVEGPVALGQRSDDAAQSSAPEALGVAWSGTLFNADDLRAELTSLGRTFRGRSDAEVLRQAYEQWGTRCVERLNGGFAFALWDGRRRTIFAARDHLGLRPLFYCREPRLFALASEPKMLFQLPEIPRRPNDGQIGEYLAGRNSVSEECFYAGVKRLPAAHSLVLDDSGTLTLHRYWEIDTDRETRLASTSDYAEKFLDLLRQSVKRRVEGQAVASLALSGGLDSPGILYLCEQMLGQPGFPRELETFSAVYSDRYADEREAIQAILEPSRARSHFFTVDTEFQFSELPVMIRHLDEPVITLATIVWWYTKRRAGERGTKVFLTGHGADELLAGINLHFFADLLVQGRWGELNREISGYARHDYYHFHRSRQGLLVQYGLKPLIPSGVRRGIKVFRGGPQVPVWINPDFARSAGLAERLQPVTPPRARSRFDRAIYEAFTRTFTPIVLQYDETCSAAFGMESRAPYLDLPLVEFLFSVPREQKVKEGVTKLIQREAFRNILPPVVIKKLDKTLVPTVVDGWLRGSHEQELSDIVHSSSFRSRSCFDLHALDSIFEQYRRGVTGTGEPQWVTLNPLRRALWRAVGLELWFRECLDHPVR